MEVYEKYNYLLLKKSIYGKIIYWLFATLLMFFVFSNKSYDIQIRIVLVSVLILMSIGVSHFVNNYLIHHYLFTGRLFLFIYLLIFTLFISFWFNFLSVFIILIYTGYYLPQTIIPEPSEIILLLSGNYLIILLSAIFHFIKEAYRRLVEKNEIEKQKQVTELKLEEAKLKLLQGQIHPHFLFNMLNNLYGLINENIDSSRNVIIKLSDLLDYMLYKCDKPTVLLKDEIQFINNYIELERVRHDDNFNITINFPDYTDDLKIAPLVLFPFVENAFKHGFHNPTESFVKIDLQIKDQQLNFNIENSISKLTNDKYLNQEGKGIGLNNIKERLELIYKDKYQLNISESENNFKVELQIELS
ncbi:MAG: sensor histidine kinase [Bacteroidales bacterium]